MSGTGSAIKVVALFVSSVLRGGVPLLADVFDEEDGAVSVVEAAT
jgi:hypothetical protein